MRFLMSTFLGQYEVPHAWVVWKPFRSDVPLSMAAVDWCYTGDVTSASTTHTCLLPIVVAVHVEKTGLILECIRRTVSLNRYSLQPGPGSAGATMDPLQHN